MNEIFGNGDPTTSSRVHLVLLGDSRRRHELVGGELMQETKRRQEYFVDLVS